MRSSLRVLALGFAGLLAWSCAGDGTTGGGIVCPEGLTACDGRCVNVASNALHCGACDVPCADGKVCDGTGQCALTCQEELTMCEGVCENLKNSKANCGECGNKCPAAHRCFDGTCVVTCEVGLVACDGECVNPLNDQRYCGVDELCMGNPCPKGQICDGTGECGVECAFGYVDCNGACIDPLSDDRYCGAYGTCEDNEVGEDCPNGYRCEDGACVITCPADFALCDGQCVDPMSNPDFCGSMGDCEGANAGTDCHANEACVQGACVDLGCLEVRPGFLGGVTGPVFSDGCWSQCAGFLDEDDGLAGDQIPMNWADACELDEDNLVRIVCGNDTLTSYRYIDVNKNVFRDLLAGTQESGIIINARDQDDVAFTVPGNEVFGDTSDPDLGGSRWGGGSGCDGVSENLVVNTTPSTCREVANCFGLEPAIAGGDIFLGVYVQE